MISNQANISNLPGFVISPSWAERSFFVSKRLGYSSQMEKESGQLASRRRDAHPSSSGGVMHGYGV